MKGDTLIIVMIAACIVSFGLGTVTNLDATSIDMIQAIVGSQLGSMFSSIFIGLLSGLWASIIVARVVDFDNKMDTVANDLENTLRGISLTRANGNASISSTKDHTQINVEVNSVIGRAVRACSQYKMGREADLMRSLQREAILQSAMPPNLDALEKQEAIKKFEDIETLIIEAPSIIRNVKPSLRFYAPWPISKDY